MRPVAHNFQYLIRTRITSIWSITAAIIDLVKWPQESKGVETIGGERRADRRYRIMLDLRWKLIRRRKLQDSGYGRTIDLSSGGVLFDPGRPMPVGLNVELSIVWPVLLHNVAPMQLLIWGRIVRCDGRQTAIMAVQHEFRTTGVPAEQRTPSPQTIQTPPPLRNAVGVPWPKLH